MTGIEILLKTLSPVCCQAVTAISFCLTKSYKPDSRKQYFLPLLRWHVPC